MSQTMKEVIVYPTLSESKLIDSPIPTPGPNEVVIKVIVAGTNPKDWKVPHYWMKTPANSGDDIAGVIHTVGTNVHEFKPNDRVAAFHKMMTPHGAFAEYAVAPASTTFHIPEKTSYEEAATLPLAALTAVVGLYADLGYKAPWERVGGEDKKKERVPLLIHGGGSAVGAFVAKFARLSGVGPVVAIAGKSKEWVEGLVDYVVDYRQGDDQIVAEVEGILEKEGFAGKKFERVFDCTAEMGSRAVISRLVDLEKGEVTQVLPPGAMGGNPEEKNWVYPGKVNATFTSVGRVHDELVELGFVWSRYLGRLLNEGRLEGHPFEVVPGGLNGVPVGLQNLKDGKASAVKYVYRVEETK